MTTPSQRIRWAELGGYVIALAGLVSVISALTSGPEPTALTLLSSAVMGLALAPVMLGFYELGGRTPERAARAALTIGIGGAVVWSALVVGWAAGVVTPDESRGATGAFAILTVAAIVIGTWLIGGSALAGSWLSTVARGLGVACGVGWLLAGAGLLIAGVGLLSDLGGVVYQLLTPVWGVFMGRRFAALRTRS